MSRKFSAAEVITAQYEFAERLHDKLDSAMIAAATTGNSEAEAAYAHAIRIINSEHIESGDYE